MDLNCETWYSRAYAKINLGQLLKINCIHAIPSQRQDIFIKANFFLESNSVTERSSYWQTKVVILLTLTDILYGKTDLDISVRIFPLFRNK